MGRNDKIDEFVTFFKEDVFTVLVDEDGKGLDGFKEIVENRRKEVETDIARREEIRKEREKGAM